jgi:hypothetical protein
MRPPAEPAHEPHRHAWTVVDFLVVADRPMMTQRCGCEATRTIPAWDRTWTPPTGRGDDEGDVSSE